NLKVNFNTLSGFSQFASILLINIGFVSGLLAQEEASGDEAVQRLHSLLEQTSSLRAEVEQLQIDQDGREVQESRVQLVMQKPSSFSWIITEPYEDVTITDGTSIWHYEPDLEQVTIQPFEADPE